MEAIRSVSPEVPESLSVINPEHLGLDRRFSVTDNGDLCEGGPASQSMHEEFDFFIEPVPSVGTQKTVLTDQSFDVPNFDEVPAVSELSAEETRPLTLVERIQSDKWQERREVYVLLADCLRARKFLIDTDTEANVFTFVEPWLKNMATDTNLTCQVEGLQTLLCFVNHSTTLSNSTLLLGDELIQRCQLVKHKAGDLVTQIVVRMLSKDSESVLFTHVVKRFSAKNPKEACSSISCVRQALATLPLSDAGAKQLFRSVKTALGHNIAEVRTIAQLLAADFYCYTEESMDDFVANLECAKAVQVKELTDLIRSRDKELVRWALGFTSAAKKDNENLLLLDESQVANENLNALVPEKFTEAPYLSDIKTKRELLLKFNHNLEAPGLCIGQGDYSQLVLTLLHLLETNNSIVYVEVFRSLEVLVPRIPKHFTYKAKHFVQFLTDKFKEKKKPILTRTAGILHLFRLHEVVPATQLVDWVVEVVSTQKIVQVKELCLKWVLNEITQHGEAAVDFLSGEVPLRWYVPAIKHFQTTVHAKLSKIHSKETCSSVKDLLLSLQKTLATLSDIPQPVQPLQAVQSEIDTSIHIESQSLLDKKSKPVVPEFEYSLDEVPERYQQSVFELIETLRELPDFKVFQQRKLLSGVLGKVDQLGPDGMLMAQSVVLSCCEWVFYQINWIKLGTLYAEQAMASLVTVIRAVVQQMSVLHTPVLLRFLRLLFQVPPLCPKKAQVEQALDEVLRLSSPLDFVEALAEVMHQIKSKKPRLTQEDKAIQCLKFLSTWVCTRIQQYSLFIPADQVHAVISRMNDLNEADSPFSSQFLKEFQVTKTAIISAVKGLKSQRASPDHSFRSKSPELMPSPISTNQLSPFTMETNVDQMELGVQRSVNSLSCLSSISYPPQSSHSSEIQRIQGFLNLPGVQSKVEGLKLLLKLIEEVQEASNRMKQMKVGSWIRGVGRLTDSAQSIPLCVEEELLVALVTDILKHCAKYSNYATEAEPSQELQELALTTLAELRTVTTKQAADVLFRLIFFELPINHCSSDFALDFNMRVYYLFSEWTTHLNFEQTVRIVTELIEQDTQHNVHLVFHHVLRWLLLVEMKTAVEIDSLKLLIPDVLKCLGGLPIKTAHPLTDTYQTLLKRDAQELLQRLISHCSEPRFTDFIGSILVNRKELFDVYYSWAQLTYSPSPQSPSFQFTNSEPSSFKETEQAFTLSKEDPYIQANLDKSKQKLDFDDIQEPSELEFLKQEEQVKEEERRLLEEQARHEALLKQEQAIRENEARIAQEQVRAQQIREQLECEQAEHQDTRKLLEEANREYMEQVAANQRLVAQLQKQTSQMIEIAQPPEPMEFMHSEASRPNVTKFNSPAVNDALGARQPLAHLARPQADARTPNSKQYKPVIEIFQPLIVLPLQSNEGITDFQHLLLHAGDPQEDITLPLLTAYAKTHGDSKRLFLSGLTEALRNRDVTVAMSIEAVRAVLEAVFKFCVSEKNQHEASMTSAFLDGATEDWEVTNMLQAAIGLLLEAKESTETIGLLLGMLKAALPLSFQHEMDEVTKHYYRLILKCVLKLLQAIERNQLEVRVFDILIELNKVFEKYPPEKLTKTSPNLAEYEYFFRTLRIISDTVISFNPSKGVDFLSLIVNSSANKGVFIKYVEATLQKKYQILA